MVRAMRDALQAFWRYPDRMIAAAPTVASVDQLREWTREAHERDGFLYCCETAEENGLTYDMLERLLDVAEAAEEHVEARYLGTRERLETALGRLTQMPSDYSPEYQDEYQRLWHEAAATRDRLKAALEIIQRGYVHAPTISDPWDPQEIAKNALKETA